MQTQKFSYLKKTSLSHTLKNINIPPKIQLREHYGRKSVYINHFKKSDISKNEKVIEEKR